MGRTFASPPPPVVATSRIIVAAMMAMVRVKRKTASQMHVAPRIVWSGCGTDEEATDANFKMLLLFFEMSKERNDVTEFHLERLWFRDKVVDWCSWGNRDPVGAQWLGLGNGRFWLLSWNYHRSYWIIGAKYLGKPIGLRNGVSLEKEDWMTIEYIWSPAVSTIRPKYWINVCLAVGVLVVSRKPVGDHSSLKWDRLVATHSSRRLGPPEWLSILIIVILTSF